MNVIFSSTNTSNNQINVSGYRTSNHTNYTIYYNDEKVVFRLDDQNSCTATTSWKNYGSIFGPVTRPSGIIQFMEQFGAIILRITSEGIVQYRSITGGTVNAASLVAYVSWEKGL